MNEMKLVIGTIVNQFQYEVDESSHAVELQPSMILKAINDIQL